MPYKHTVNILVLILVLVVKLLTKNVYNVLFTGGCMMGTLAFVLITMVNHCRSRMWNIIKIFVKKVKN